MQKKTQRPVQFEITEQTREAVVAWIAAAHRKSDQFLFPSRVSASPYHQPGSTTGSSVPGRGRLGSIRRPMAPIRCGAPKPTLIYRRTKNLRAIQLLLGHTKLESTVRYLGIEVDDALEIAEQTEV
jgi:integrase